MFYNIDMRMGDILDNEQTAAIFERFLPGMRARVEAQAATRGMSVRKLAEYAKGAISESSLEAMDAELRKIPCEEESMEKKIEALKSQPLTKGAAERLPAQRATAIYPGRVWRDTEGRRIQAHGGALFYEDGLYY